MEDELIPMGVIDLVLFNHEEIKRHLALKEYVPRKMSLFGLGGFGGGDGSPVEEYVSDVETLHDILGYIDQAVESLNQRLAVFYEFRFKRWLSYKEMINCYDVMGYNKPFTEEAIRKNINIIRSIVRKKLDGEKVQKKDLLLAVDQYGIIVKERLELVGGKWGGKIFVKSA